VPHVEAFGLWDVVTYFEEHKAETERQRDRLAERLRNLGRKAKHQTRPKDRLTSVLVGLRGERPFHDTAVRLGAEAMEVAVYEMLVRLADRAGDEETAALAREHLAQEQAMAERIDDDWDRLVDISLAATGVNWEPEQHATTTPGRMG
jgi:ferritin-like metal-binding protein YciE